MIYLIEPSTLRLNKMIRRDRAILSKIRGMKIVLNMSLLDPTDIKDFEGEAGCSVFHNVPPLDDKKDKHRVLDELLNKLAQSIDELSSGSVGIIKALDVSTVKLAEINEFSNDLKNSATEE